ncbi:MAG: hypothetical protein CMO55_03360 [Verrucomicrobiales bacterium]|nr:hypothetical protein [Verrucomicrobiales bacterium]
MSTSESKPDIELQGNMAVVIYKTHDEAAKATSELQQAGFDVEKLSLIDQDSGRRSDRWGHQRAGLYSMGIPKTIVDRYEEALKAHQFIVIAQWVSEEFPGGREIIDRTSPESVDEWQCGKI